MLLDLRTDFSRVRSGGLAFTSLSEFSKFIVMHTVKGFGIVNKAELDFIFPLELSCFFDDPMCWGFSPQDLEVTNLKE